MSSQTSSSKPIPGPSQAIMLPEVLVLVFEHLVLDGNCPCRHSCSVYGPAFLQRLPSNAHLLDMEDGCDCGDSPVVLHRVVHVPKYGKAVSSALQISTAVSMSFGHRLEHANPGHDAPVRFTLERCQYHDSKTQRMAYNLAHRPNSSSSRSHHPRERARRAVGRDSILLQINSSPIKAHKPYDAWI